MMQFFLFDVDPDEGEESEMSQMHGCLTTTSSGRGH
jgi:hypothetical protein